MTPDAAADFRPAAAAGAARVPITVVLATRNRPSGAARAAQSILASDYPSYAVIIVDQSDDASTRAALRGVSGDPRVTVIEAPAHGLAAARNLGVAQCRTPLVAFTDDDCVAAPGWLAGFADAFAADPAVGIVFGSVVAAAYDRGAGFIPAYLVVRARTARSLADKPTVEGIGACMSIRRATWEALGGFDECLGAGSALRAGEDTDFAVRTLIAGGSVHETPAASVIHFGFRRWDEGPATIAGYMTGLGAVHAKMLRLAGFGAVPPLAALGWRWLARRPVVDLNHRPPRMLRLMAFLRGAWRGWCEPLDRDKGRFCLRRAGAAPIAGNGPFAPK